MAEGGLEMGAKRLVKFKVERKSAHSHLMVTV